MHLSELSSPFTFHHLSSSAIATMSFTCGCNSSEQPKEPQFKKSKYFVSPPYPGHSVAVLFPRSRLLTESSLADPLHDGSLHSRSLLSLSLSSPSQEDIAASFAVNTKYQVWIVPHDAVHSLPTR